MNTLMKNEFSKQSQRLKNSREMHLNVVEELYKEEIILRKEIAEIALDFTNGNTLILKGVLFGLEEKNKKVLFHQKEIRKINNKINNLNEKIVNLF